MKKSFEKYLRRLILENAESVSLKKSPRVNEPLVNEPDGI